MLNPFSLFSPPCRKIAISPEPNLRWTSDQSVNSSLSVVVQFNRGGPTKLEITFFQIVKLRFTTISTIFDTIPNFLREQA